MTQAPAPARELTVAFRSMASDVTLRVVEPGPDAEARVALARGVVERVATTCTRFDPTSDLMRANAAGRRWAVVAPECFAALRAAHAAHVATDGLFDPRVLEVLTSYGYGTSLPFEAAAVTTEAAAPPRRPRHAWRPSFDEARSAVRVGRHPIDLGGIGKGLAVRWAARHLRGAGQAALVEAGGDLIAIGAGPEGEGWLVGVEDPFGGEGPVAVLRVVDRACATSSVRVRAWRAGGGDVHHLVDPRTGRSAESGLRAVTVVGADPALAEVWSKTLFVSGRDRIRAVADERRLAAVWVDDDGRIGTSRAVQPHLDWQVSRV